MTASLPADRRHPRRRPSGLLLLGLAVFGLFIGIEIQTLRSYVEVRQTTAAFDAEVDEITTLANLQRELLLYTVAADRRLAGHGDAPVEVHRALLDDQIRRYAIRSHDEPEQAAAVAELSAGLDRIDALLAPVDGRISDAQRTQLLQQLRDVDELAHRIHDAEEASYFQSVDAALGDRADNRALLVALTLTLAIAAAAFVVLSRRTAKRRHDDADEALAESEARYRAVVNGVRDVIFTTDLSGHWTFLSPAWTALTGFDIEDTLGTTFIDAVYPPDRESCPSEFAALVDGRAEQMRKEVRYLTASGTPVDVEVWVRIDDDGAGTIGTISDRSSQRAFEKRLEELALQDPLTGLANRTLLNQHLTAALSRCARGSANLAVLFMDLDRFKLVNDTLGHDTGDELLVAVSSRVRDSLRPYDSAARLGGDEFVVVCGDLDPDPGVALAQARQVSQRLEQAIKTPFALHGREIVVTASVGITLADAGATAESLLAQADAAMYRAKDLGKGRHEVYDDALREKADWYFETEHALRRALSQDEFRLHYQPVVGASSGLTLGVEALLRWERPDHGLVAPGAFLDVAEDMGLMREIGAWVIEQAAADLASWEALRPSDEFTVAVNLSARQLASAELAPQMREVMARHDIDANRLCVEITENHVLDADERTLETLTEIHEMGILLAMDDFGTGYSSLSFLRRLPIDVLKVDRSFVERLGVEDEDTRIVELVLSLGRSLGLTTVGEGVERPSQLRMLRALGCDRIQGYLISRPITADVIADRLAAERAPVAAALDA